MASAAWAAQGMPHAAQAATEAGANAAVEHRDEEEEEEEEEQEHVFLGMFKTVIVGIRYYTGRVGVNEMVTFVREPDNPYDANAVRVENISNEKVGHLKRELVYEIAHLMDDGGLQIEGIMPGGSKSTYTLPIHVYCFGRDAAGAAPLRAALLRVGIALEEMSLQEAAEAAAGRGSSRGSGGSGRAGSGGGAGRDGFYGSGVTTYLSPAQMDNSLTRMFEDLYASSTSRPRMDPSNEVLSRLFPHQQEALAWLVARENSNALPPFWTASSSGGGGGVLYTNTLTNHETRERPAPLRGGILADDMGLGKTLTAISLIATNRPGAQLPPLLPPTQGPSAAAAAAAAAAAGGSGGSGAGGEPAAAAAAAGDDDDDKAAAARPGKRRKKDATTPKGSKPKAAKKSKAGTSPGSASKLKAAAEAAAEAGAAAVAAAEPPATPPAADGPRGTLIVCPLSVISNWQLQLEEHTAGNMEVHVYHGPERNRSRTFLSRQDVVITTYATLAADVGGHGGQGLLGVTWLRVVLDEGHVIRNPKGQQAKTCHALKATRRWVLSGTPLQNRLGDVHGLLVFLGLQPLADRAFWRRCVERPLKQRDGRGLMALKVLMGSLALRRTKDTPGPNGQPLVALPPKSVALVTLQLGADDAANYALLEQETRSLVAHHLSRGTLTENYTNVLAIILRLRQVCNSSRLCPGALEALRLAAVAARQSGPGAAPPPPELLAALLEAMSAGGEDGVECAICLSPLEQPCITTCAHVFCRRCIESVIVRDKPCCPLCRRSITSDSLIDPPPPAAEGEEGQEQEPAEQAGEDAAAATAAAAAAHHGSSKIQALLAKLRAVQQQDEAVGPIKSVVFSQFTGMLDLVQGALAAEGITFVRIDGKTSAGARKAALQAFAGLGPDSPRVMLASLKAMGLGTNLTSASHVHMLEPSWTPAVEDQAMDRVHRLGQVRPVHVWRYVGSGTIEERMLQLQERKARLAKAAWVEQQQPQQEQQQEQQPGSSAAAAAAGSGSRAPAARSSLQRDLAGIGAADFRLLMQL